MPTALVVLCCLYVDRTPQKKKGDISISFEADAHYAMRRGEQERHFTLPKK